ncbi:MAG: DNA repair protein RecN [Clostridia bacterium]|nr:DNA repair protein RecN [Clostridia bacterium]
MLCRLYIENIALIEKTEVCLKGGLTVLTGETGAGKSIVIDSIGAVLGERVSREIIRTGAKKASVSAVFEDISAATLTLLAQLETEPDEDGRLYLSREIFADGKNNCRINGRPVSVSELRSVGGLLINVHGQHDSQALLNEEKHIYYLDLFADNGELIEDFTRKYEQYLEVKNQLKKIKSDIGDREREKDMLSFQVDELRRAELKEGEYDSALSRRNFLQNAEKLAVLLNSARQALGGGEYSDGAVSLVSSATGFLHDVEKFYDGAASLSQKASEALYMLEDIEAELADLCDRTDFEPAELEQLEQRLSQITSVTRKYGGSEQKALEYLENALARLEILEGGDQAAEELENLLSERLETVKDAARNLRASRRKAALDFEKRVADELEFLDMQGVSFKAVVEPAGLGSDGADSVRFMLSANRGEELRPLAKIASGGELSRIMLAIKNVLAGCDDIDTLIFDEVDAGISGKAAYKVGKKLHETARYRQIICVTHLAQIAAQADNHIYIEKNPEEDRTVTTLTELNFEGRKKELARIIGGGMISDSALGAAEDMLKNSK